MKKSPNILFITTDQQRRDTLGCYGNGLIRTPNVDKLASKGMVFDRAYCENPICLPSRLTMITGKKSSHHGVTVHNSSMRNSEKTMGEILQRNNYRTHFIGKPHFKSQQHRNTEESIADWKDGRFDNWNGPYAGFETVEMILGHSNSLVGHYGKWLRERHPEKYHLFKSDKLEPLTLDGGGTYRNRIPEDIYSSAWVGDRTCSFIDSVKDSRKPFYCFASFPDPHWPIMPPEPYFSMYDNVEMPKNTPYNYEAEKDNYPEQFRKAAEGKRTCYNGGGAYLKENTSIEKIMRPYWGAITLIDKNVGRILDKLEECGMEENTIVVFTTDHGEYMGCHGMIAKGGFLWEEFIKVPFIINYPELIRRNCRTNAMFSFVDIVPTLLDLAGITENESAFDGISQVRVLSGAEDELRECITVMHASLNKDVPDQHCLVSRDGWKLVYYAGCSNGELYNLSSDPEELDNLYNNPRCSKIQNELIGRLLDQLILQRDMEPVIYSRTADHFGRHVMSDEHWHDEFERMAALTGVR